MSDVSLLGSYGGAGGAGLMFRNKLINGNFDIWQRGESQTSSAYGSDDRWRNTSSGSTKTHSRQAFSLGQTDVPGSPKYFSRTVVSSVTGSGNLAYKAQKIEGVETLAGKKATLSFWAKADSNKNMAIEFIQEFGTGGTPSTTVLGIGSQKVALTSSWQKFEISVDIPSVAGKTLGTGGGDSLALQFWFDAGSNYDARTDSLGQQSGTFDIAQVQLEEGPVASPFEQRPIGMELSLCQRYYEKSYNVNVTPETNTDQGAAVLTVASNTLANMAFSIPYKVTKRAAPNSRSFWSKDGTSDRFSVFSTGALISTTNILPSNNNGTSCLAFYNGGTGTTNYFAVVMHWAVDAEL